LAKVPQMALTDLGCKTAQCPLDKPRARFADSGGLYLEVVPTGGKHWRWKYRFGGKEKRLALGTYPAVTLSMARRERDKAREQLRSGQDPVAIKHEAKLTARIRLENNFESVARAWHLHWKTSKSARHADYVIRRLEADIFPDLGAKPITEISPPLLLSIIRKIEDRDANDIAKRAWQTCSQIFRYAVANGIAERNPTADVRPSDALKPRVKGHYARLEPKELPELLRKIEAYSGAAATRLAMKLMALTFVRTGELIGARWEEFDLDTAEWRIPAARMKMKTMHIVPLSSQAVEVLRAIEHLRGLSGLLFQGERDHAKPMSNNTILGALKRMGYAGRMTGHGFRGMASTILHELGFEHKHIELQLAHEERNAISAAYNNAQHLEARRKMMQDWANHLDAIRLGTNVIPLRAA